ncbi:MAG: hypothetical protein Q7R66_17365 [Undibacterium sp.]|uniref:hypothetical protein n=1 Tax=Undibacterium sp. TaxID=1914977 RepID=UPI002724F213|nr:hypothetical protein [Undibacterium sp.]MDO8653944.1 hypothetical protein [Undibacterium sp.]
MKENLSRPASAAGRTVTARSVNEQSITFPTRSRLDKTHKKFRLIVFDKNFDASFDREF